MDWPIADPITTIDAAEVEDVARLLVPLDTDLARIDRGRGATSIAVSAHDDVAVIHLLSGFTMVGEASVKEGLLGLALPMAIGDTPPVWDGRRSHVGDLMACGAHYPVQVSNPVDSVLGVITAGWDALVETAEICGTPLDDWTYRKAHLDPNHALPILDLLHNGFLTLDRGSDRAELLRLVTAAISERPSRRDVSRRADKSLAIVSRTSEWMDVTGAWMPSLAEICRATGVSERRLRTAFVEIYDMPPTAFFRARALSAVRKTLLDRSANGISVTAAATGHGFRHLGLFSRHYQRMFGELPSRTIASAQH